VLYFPNILNWIKAIISPKLVLNIPKTDHHYFQIFVAVACDLLWFSRNKAFHDGIAFDALQLSRNVNKVSMEHLVASKSVPTKSVDDKRIPPPPSIFKINFDTSIRDSFSLQAAVCRNHNGQIIQQVTQVSQPCHPNMGESLAARLAVSLAISLRLNHFIIEGIL
jgi:hypothetical protein